MRPSPSAGTLAAMNIRSQCHPQATRAAAAVAFVAAAVLLAACGSSPSSPGSGGTPAATGVALSPSALAFAQCMRSHGVPEFPDPGGNGPGLQGSAQQMAQQLGVSVSRLRAASATCLPLNPKANSSGSRPLTAQEEQDYLRAAACMRSHGVSGFPDPSFTGGHVSLSIPSSINTSSPQVIRAIHTCQKLIPAGLPYSGTD